MADLIFLFFLSEWGEEKEEEIEPWCREKELTYIVDVQGFQFIDTDFIPKEISVVNAERGAQVCHLLFKPPIPFDYLEETFVNHIQKTSYDIHGLDWDDGNYAYNTLGTILMTVLEDAKFVILKGPAKQKLFEALLPHATVINADIYRAPPLKQIIQEYGVEDDCSHHVWGGKRKCSLRTSQSLYFWLCDNIDKRE